MNKENEALLKKVEVNLEEPISISMKSILRMIERMQPKTEDMHAYIIAYFSAKTAAEREAIHKAQYAKISSSQSKAFETAYLQCVENDLNYVQKYQTA